MTSNDIYSILSSKPHNPHQLTRYIKFVSRCATANENSTEYTEKHHICPKAKGLFPEFKSFEMHPWNMCRLTQKQHYIAHVMLSKVYKSIGSANFTVKLMKDPERARAYNKTKQLHTTNKVHECIYCRTKMKGGNFYKYHGDKCKLNPNRVMPPKYKCTHCGIECDANNYKRSHGDNCRILVGRRKLNLSDEAIDKIKASGRRMKGIKKTESHKRAISESAKVRPHVICPYCGKSGQAWIMSRWHFENCKYTSQDIPKVVCK